MSTNASKKALQDKVLGQMRKTRAQIEKDHPQLFKALRLLVAQSQAEAKPVAVKREPAAERAVSGDTVAIDRQKNLEAIIKYAALNPGSEKLKAQLKEFIN